MKPTPAATPARLPVPQDAAGWSQLLPHLKLSGIDRQLAENCTVLSCDGDLLRLGIVAAHQLLIEVAAKRVEQRIVATVDRPVRVRFEVVSEVSDTPADQNVRQQQARQSDAEAGFAADPHVQAAMQALDAQIAPGSVRPRSD